MSGALPRAVRVRRRVGYAMLAATVVTFVGSATLDHGYNWDEWYHIGAMRQTVEDLRFQTGGHSYNGFYWTPGYAVLLAHGIDDIPSFLGEMAANPTLEFRPERYTSIRTWQEDMLRLLSTERYKAEVRLVFLLLTAPAIFWVFFTVLRIYPHHYLAAGAAAGALGLSWEIQQRARNIEADAPQMQFVALLVFMIACATTARTRARGYLYACGLGLAAACIIACKPSGVYAVVVGLITVLAIPHFKGVRDRAVLAALLFGSVVVTMLVVSPHTTLDPFRAAHAPMAVWTDYQSVTDVHPAWVDGPLEHLGKVCQWLFLVCPSWSMPVAALMCIPVAIGFWSLGKDQRRFAILAGLYPAITLFTMTQLSLLQSRNYTQHYPFVALGFGVGVAALARMLRARPRDTRFLAALVGAVFLFNAGWLVWAQHANRTITRDSILADVREHVAEADHDLRVSPRAQAAVGDTLEEHYECARAGGDDAGLNEPRVLMYYTDHTPWRWTMNTVGWVERTFAPPDANYDWYALWKGRLEHHRIVLMSEEHADEMQVAFRAWVACRRR